MKSAQLAAARLAFLSEDDCPRYLEQHGGWFRVYEDAARRSAARIRWRAMTDEYFQSPEEAVDAAMEQARAAERVRVVTQSSKRGGDRASYVDAGRRAGQNGLPNRPAAGKYMREPWQRTAFREGWAKGRAERDLANSTLGLP